MKDKSKPTSQNLRINVRRNLGLNLHGISIPIPEELDLPAGAPFEGQLPSAASQIPTDIRELLSPLVEIATNTWRLKVRMLDHETGEAKAEYSKLFRFVEGLQRALTDAGIQTVDKTGKQYSIGMSEKVISFEQTPGLLREEIIETVRPSIRWKEQPLFHGEIIVGIPVISQDALLAMPTTTEMKQELQVDREVAVRPSDSIITAETANTKFDCGEHFASTLAPEVQASDGKTPVAPDNSLVADPERKI